MPIYAYKCDACGFSKDVLQKMSDDPLTDCPNCGKAEFKKQVTAAGFQLKGSGWYVTDFRGDSGGGADKPETSGVSAVSGAAAVPAADGAAPSAAPAAAAPAAQSSTPTPAASGPAPAASA